MQPFRALTYPALTPQGQLLTFYSATQDIYFYFFLDVDFSQKSEPDVHLFSAARPSSFGEDVVSCEAGWHGFRKVGCSGSSNSGAYPNLPRDILCLTYGMAEAPSHCPSPHQRIHLSRAYTKARSPTIQK